MSDKVIEGAAAPGTILSDPELVAELKRHGPIEVPTEAEVLAAGYSPEAAKSIIARQKALAADYKASSGVGPLDYVLVKHMARSRDTRAERRGTAGNRYHDVRLGTGRRIRRRGERLTEVNFTDLLENQENLLEMVKCGRIRVYDPTTEEVIPFEMLKGGLANMLGHCQRELDEVVIGDSKDEEPSTEELSPLPPGDLAEKALQPPAPPVDNDHIAPGSERFSEETIAQAAEAPVIPSAPPAKADDVGLEPVEPTAEAPVEASDEPTGAPGVPPADTTENGEPTKEVPVLEMTEETLMAMNRHDLNRLAKEAGVAHPEKFSSKEKLMKDVLKAKE